MLIGFGGLTKMNNGLVRSNVEVLESSLRSTCMGNGINVDKS